MKPKTTEQMVNELLTRLGIPLDGKQGSKIQFVQMCYIFEVMRNSRLAFETLGDAGLVIKSLEEVIITLKEFRDESHKIFNMTRNN